MVLKIFVVFYCEGKRKEKNNPSGGNAEHFKVKPGGIRVYC
jgi:hypothetical protein